MTGTIWVTGGERVVGDALLRAADENGVRAVRVTEEELAPARGDAVVDLGSAPAEWRTDLRESERARQELLLGRGAPATRWVRASVLGASQDSLSLLKSAAGGVESALRDARPDAVVLRAGILLGDCGLVRLFRRYVERSKLILLPGIEASRFEPLAVPDFAQYCVLAATASAPPDECYDLGCGEMVSGGLFVRNIADTLGLDRWRVPCPPVLAGAIALFLGDAELPASAVRIWLECLSEGLLPRRMSAWEHFDVQPMSLAEATAASVGMLVPIRPRGDERFGNWRAPGKKGILWSRGSSARR